MRQRVRAAVVLLTTLTLSLILYLRFRSYDLVSVGLCRVAPFSAPCVSSRLDLQPLSSMDTQKIHTSQYGRARGRISISIGSINIRFSRDAAYDSTRSMLSSLDPLIKAAGARNQLDEDSVLSTEADGASRGSPFLMQQYHGERSWLLRGPKVADVPLFHDWDIFAFQEVLDNQYNNLVHWLGQEYDHAGVGRDDGARAGEAVPIFWRRDAFELVNETHGGIGETGVEHFWLSSTPDLIGSVGWDAALTRMCTHVSLRLIATGEVVHVFSTHYDHQGVVARAKSSELILDRARKASEHTKEVYSHEGGRHLAEPLVVLIGDLNSPRNEGSWSTLVSPHYGLAANSSGSSFLDTALSVPTRFISPLLTDNEDPRRAEYASGKKLPSRSPETSKGGILSEPVGPLRTFTDFHPSPRTAIEDRIDFIMILGNEAVLDQTRQDAKLHHARSPTSPGKPKRALHLDHTSTPTAPQSDSAPNKTSANESKWRIRAFGTLPNWSEADAGFLISDHRPVMARIQRSFSLQ